MTMERPGMRRFVNCEENGEVVLHSDEQMLYSLNQVEVSFSQVEQDILGKFDLKVTSSRLIVINQDSAYEFDIPFIGLHAVSRDPQSYHKPCLYCQLDQEEGESPDELFLAPENEESLKEIFEAFCAAAALNPDPLEQGEEEEDDELIYNIDEVNLGAHQAQMLAHFDSVFQEPPPGQFDDVEQQHEDNDDDDEKLEPPKKK